MSTAQIKALEDFIRLHNRNALNHAIRTGVELGVIRALGEGQKTVNQLARQLDLKQEPLNRLMKVLAETELVESYGEFYALSQVARLIPEPSLDLGDRYWRHLAEHIRTGVGLPDGSTQHSELDYILNKATEEWTLTPAAMDAAQVLDVGKTRRGLRILEIECGSAVFGVTMAHRDPDSVLNLVDNEIGLNRARATIDSVGLHKVNLIQADSLKNLQRVPELTGQEFDLVVVAGLIHRRSTAECQQLLTDLYQLVRPQRELVVIDIFPGQENGAKQRAVFELELSLRTSSGKLADPNGLKQLIESAGFSTVQYAHLPSVPFYWGLMLATRH